MVSIQVERIVSVTRAAGCIFSNLFFMQLGSKQMITYSHDCLPSMCQSLPFSGIVALGSVLTLVTTQVMGGLIKVEQVLFGN